MTTDITWDCSPSESCYWDVQVPRGCQCMLMSATMNKEVERLQKLVLHNPITLDLLAADASAASRGGNAAGPGPGSAAEIEHYAIRCERCAAPFFAHACRSPRCRSCRSEGLQV